MSSFEDEFAVAAAQHGLQAIRDFVDGGGREVLKIVIAVSTVESVEGAIVGMHELDGSGDRLFGDMIEFTTILAGALGKRLNVVEDGAG